MNATAPGGLLGQPPLALLAGCALAQGTILALLAASGQFAPFAFLAVPVAFASGALAVCAFVHAFSLRRPGPRRTLVAYVLVAASLATLGLAGPFLSEAAREVGAIRSAERADLSALRREALAILEKFRASGDRPVQVGLDDWGPALQRLGPVRVLRFREHVKVRMYGLESAYSGLWLMAPGYTIEARMLGEGVYWVPSDAFGYMAPTSTTAPVDSSRR